jgi:hypothetical protein
MHCSLSSHACSATVDYAIFLVVFNITCQPDCSTACALAYCLCTLLCLLCMLLCYTTLVACVRVTHRYCTLSVPCGCHYWLLLLSLLHPLLIDAVWLSLVLSFWHCSHAAFITSPFKCSSMPNLCKRCIGSLFFILQHYRPTSTLLP